MIIKTVPGAEWAWGTDGRECTWGCHISNLCEIGQVAILRTMERMALTENY